MTQRQKPIDLQKIMQEETTIAGADASGLFDEEVTDFVRNDWKSRVAVRPQEPVYVYRYGAKRVLLGWIEGEVADFNTLTEWCGESRRAGRI